MEAIKLEERKMTTIQMLTRLQYSENQNVAQLSKKILNSGDVDAAIEEELQYTGGFMTAVLKGDYAEAYKRADGFNKAILSHLIIDPTGRLTYRELGKLINQMSEEQLEMDVIIEDPWENESFAGELTICGPEHEVLDDFHPTIRMILIEGMSLNELKEQKDIDSSINESEAEDALSQDQKDNPF